MPRCEGWISSIEDQGYLGDPYKPQTPMLNGWGVEKAKRLGATGVKILMKYHPDSGEVAEKQQELVEGVLAEGRRHEIPLFLEPICYPLDPDMPYSSPEFAALRRDIVVRTAKTFSDLGADILKMEFPIDAKFNSDEGLTFTLPGLVGTEDFDGISAVQSGPITGGYSGIIKVPTDDDIEVAQELLSKQMNDSIKQEFADRMPDGFIIHPDLQFVSEIDF